MREREPRFEDIISFQFQGNSENRVREKLEQKKAVKFALLNNYKILIGDQNTHYELYQAAGVSSNDAIITGTASNVAGLEIFVKNMGEEISNDAIFATKNKVRARLNALMQESRPLAA